MKKLVLLLSVMLLSTPVFAQQCTVTRLQKEMSDILRPTINTQSTPVQSITTLTNGIQGSHLWRPGWTQSVTADVLPSTSNGCKPITPPLTLVEEQQLTPTMQYYYNQIFMQTLMKMRQNPVDNQRYTQEKINKLLGK